MRQEALIWLMDGLHMQDVEDVSSGVCIVQMQRSYIDDRQNACMALLRFFSVAPLTSLGHVLDVGFNNIQFEMDCE